MLTALEHLKSFIAKCIIVLMAVTATFSTIDLAWLLIKDLMTPPTFLLDIDELKEIFGLFLLVLIALELLESIKTYLTNKSIHAEVEIILLIAIIAVARKVIIMDVDTLPFQTLLGIAAIIPSLVGGYFLMKRLRKGTSPVSPPDQPC
jgi:uncharacterized membrane protein (DUF373 family)